MATRHQPETEGERVELSLIPPPWPTLTPEHAEEWLSDRVESFAEMIVVGLEDEAVSVEPKRTRSALSMLALDLETMRVACARVGKTGQPAVLQRAAGANPALLEDLALLLAVENTAYDLAGARAALAGELVFRLRGRTTVGGECEREA